MTEGRIEISAEAKQGAIEALKERGLVYEHSAAGPMMRHTEVDVVLAGAFEPMRAHLHACFEEWLLSDEVVEGIRSRLILEAATWRDGNPREILRDAIQEALEADMDWGGEAEDPPVAFPSRTKAAKEATEQYARDCWERLRGKRQPPYDQLHERARRSHRNQARLDLARAYPFLHSVFEKQRASRVADEAALQIEMPVALEEAAASENERCAICSAALEPGEVALHPETKAEICAGCSQELTYPPVDLRALAGDPQPEDDQR